MSNILQQEKHKGLLLDSVNGFDVLQCEGCGYTHIMPIPSPEELQPVYGEYYYAIEKPNYFVQHREDLEWWNMVNGERYDFFENHLPAHARKIVDIGSGPGFFLKLGQERGWETLGIEPSRQAAEHARQLGLTIVNDFLTESNVNQFGKFHVVYMHEVLEHLRDPKKMLQQALQLLHPGGMVCVIVPNDYNPFQKVLSDWLSYSPWWVAPPHHINYFNFQSLRQLVESVGFDVLHVTTTFPMELFLLMGNNYVGNEAIGRAVHSQRKQFELNLVRGDLQKLRQELYLFLSSKGVGREIVLYAKAP